MGEKWKQFTIMAMICVPLINLNLFNFSCVFVSLLIRFSFQWKNNEWMAKQCSSHSVSCFWELFSFVRHSIRFQLPHSIKTQKRAGKTDSAHNVLKQNDNVGSNNTISAITHHQTASTRKFEAIVFQNFTATKT